MVAVAQQRQEPLHDLPRTVQVGLRGLTDDAEVGGDRALPGVIGDRGVVHQDVELAVSVRCGGSGFRDAGGVGDVQAQRRRARYPPGGGRRGCGVTGGQQDGVALARELTADLPADPAVGAGHQRDSCHIYYVPAMGTKVPWNQAGQPLPR